MSYYCSKFYCLNKAEFGGVCRSCCPNIKGTRFCEELGCLNNIDQRSDKSKCWYHLIEDRISKLETKQEFPNFAKKPTIVVGGDVKEYTGLHWADSFQFDIGGNYKPVETKREESSAEAQVRSAELHNRRRKQAQYTDTVHSGITFTVPAWQGIQPTKVVINGKTYVLKEEK